MRRGARRGDAQLAGARRGPQAASSVSAFGTPFRTWPAPRLYRERPAVTAMWHIMHVLSVKPLWLDGTGSPRPP